MKDGADCEYGEYLRTVMMVRVVKVLRVERAKSSEDGDRVIT